MPEREPPTRRPDFAVWLEVDYVGIVPSPMVCPTEWGQAAARLACEAARQMSMQQSGDAFEQALLAIFRAAQEASSVWTDS